jgi:hypothetical protein
MDNMFISMGISILLTALKDSVKNPKKKEELRKAMLKVYTSIKALYAGDEDFE